MRHKWYPKLFGITGSILNFLLKGYNSNVIDHDQQEVYDYDFKNLLSYQIK